MPMLSDLIRAVGGQDDEIFGYLVDAEVQVKVDGEPVEIYAHDHADGVVTLFAE